MFQATLKKMRTENLQPINYFLEVDSGFLQLNQLLGKTIQLEHTGSQCLHCGLEILRSHFFLRSLETCPQDYSLNLQW